MILLDEHRGIEILAEDFVGAGVAFDDAMRAFRIGLVRAALSYANRNATRAATRLRVHRNTIYNVLREGR